MKDRLITGAGFWTATSVVLIAAFATIVALPYTGISESSAAPASTQSQSAPLPPIAHAQRPRLSNAEWERQWESAAAAMLARSRSTATPARPNSNPPRPGGTTVVTNGDLAEEPLSPLEVGRAALAMVGADPEAESIWLNIINDPSIDAEDRQNLIEDLNEEGFPDPKNLTQADLPLIEARLALIDKLTPQAMDNTNAAAFAEARKDLLEMRTKLKPEPASHTEPPR